jgi:hypothetical protein
MKTWKKLLLYFVSITGLFLVSVAVIMACSDEPDPYDYYTSFFNPAVQGQKDFGAFYFTDYRFTYSEEEPASEATVNAAEWANYLGKPVRSADVEKIMYGLDNAGKERVHHFFDQASSVSDSLSENKFLIALKDDAHEPARKYYQFARQAELLGQSSYNYWEPAPVDTAALKTVAEQALQAAIAETDSFLKLRYFYQAQKLNHYAENYEEAEKIYDEYIAKIPSQSHVKGWALALKAGEERQIGDTTQAAYLFSKVFANYPERRVQAYRNYHYIEPPLANVLKFARTPEEKATLYAIKGFANPEIETANLEEVYANAPSSPLVGVLLVREINKLEQYYLTPALNNNTDQFYSSNKPKTVSTTPVNGQTGKWLLWAGLIILFLGAIILFIGFRKQNGKPGIKIAGRLLILAGLIGIVWFSIARPNATPKEQQLPNGSFFVTMPDSVKTKYEAHIEKLRDFCTKLTGDAKYKEPQIGALVNSYLYFMQNKPGDGLSTLAKIDGKGLNGNLNDQKQMLTLLLSAQRLKQVKAVDENAMLPSMRWLNNKVIADRKTNKDGYLITPDQYNKWAINQRNFYTYVLAPAYLRQSDTARAALALQKSENASTIGYRNHMFRQMPDFWYKYLRTAQVKQIINWRMHPPADPYLSFLSDGLKLINKSDFFELLGTTQLREHHYNEALVSFRSEKVNLKHGNRGEETIAEGTIFNETINDYPQYITAPVSKFQFAKSMAALENKLKADPRNPDVYYKMATAIYNTSTYRLYWNIISYEWTSYDFGRKSLYYYDDDYVKTLTAKQYYLKARDLSTDLEFKAKCTFMAAKCEQKKYEAPAYDDPQAYDNYLKREKQYYITLKQNSYFKEMNQFKNTVFYKKAVNECSYLRDFINGK